MLETLTGSPSLKLTVSTVPLQKPWHQSMLLELMCQPPLPRRTVRVLTVVSMNRPSMATVSSPVGLNTVVSWTAMRTSTSSGTRLGSVVRSVPS